MISDTAAGVDVSRRTREVLSGDGTRLFVEEFGLDDDAPLLVFSHGWACQGRFWRPQIDYFAKTHRVVVYDQRGHGWSDRGQAPLSSSVLADDLEAVLRAVVTLPRKAMVVGHSMGGVHHGLGGGTPRLGGRPFPRRRFGQHGSIRSGQQVNPDQVATAILRLTQARVRLESCVGGAGDGQHATDRKSVV